MHAHTDPLAPSFLVTPCPSCARETVAHRVLSGGDLAWACEACDAHVDERAGRWVSADTLDDLGYFVDGHEETEPHGGGGCRGGRCGVTQPER
jgi:hypothetical protein